MNTINTRRAATGFSTTLDLSHFFPEVTHFGRGYSRSKLVSFNMIRATFESSYFILEP